MVAVAVVAVIVAALLLVLLARTVVTLTYSDDFLVVLKILFIKIQLFPKKTKKTPTRLTKKQLLRLEKKKAKKAAKKAGKKSKKQGGGENSDGEKSNKKSKKLGIVENLTVIKDIFASVAPKLAKYLKITLAKIYIAVATGDAAKTAITYGVVSQSVAYLVEALDQNANLKGKPDVSVTVDYLAEKTCADLEIKLSLRVWQVLYILLPALFEATKLKK